MRLELSRSDPDPAGLSARPSSLTNTLDQGREGIPTSSPERSTSPFEANRTTPTMAPGHVSPLFRALAPATRTGTALGRRTISQSARNAQAAVVGTEPIGTVGTIPARKPVGGLRGG